MKEIERTQKDMTTFYLNPDEIDLFIYQNKANFTGDYVDGCLLDNFILSCKRGYAAVYEHYRNAWKSDYKIVFAPYKNLKDVDRLFSDFIEFEEKEEQTA